MIIKFQLEIKRSPKPKKKSPRKAKPNESNSKVSQVIRIINQVKN